MSDIDEVTPIAVDPPSPAASPITPPACRKPSWNCPADIAALEDNAPSVRHAIGSNLSKPD